MSLIYHVSGLVSNVVVCVICHTSGMMWHAHMHVYMYTPTCVCVCVCARAHAHACTHMCECKILLLKQLALTAELILNKSTKMCFNKNIRTLTLTS